jgi:hypothetical protein
MCVRGYFYAFLFLRMTVIGRIGVNSQIIVAEQPQVNQRTSASVTFLKL